MPPKTRPRRPPAPESPVPRTAASSPKLRLSTPSPSAPARGSTSATSSSACGSSTSTSFLRLLLGYYGMDVADLRQTRSRAGKHWISSQIPWLGSTSSYPWPSTKSAFHVAMADQPSPELIALLQRDERDRHPPDAGAPRRDPPRHREQLYLAIGGLEHLVQAFEAVEGARRRGVETTTLTPDVVDEDAPVVQVVGQHSDAGHARPGVRRPYQTLELGVHDVRYRIDGALKEVLTLPSSMGVGLISRIKIMAGMNVVEQRRPQDGRAAHGNRW